MPGAVEQYASKVPEVTLVFWIIKIAATTLGETGGDSVTMTLNRGYLVRTAIFFALLVSRRLSCNPIAIPAGSRHGSRL
jgi:uncharacterized membrane-anchored protein